MKFITLYVHGLIDYFLSLILIVAPSLLGMSGEVAIFIYVFAGVHFVLAICTDFPLGIFKMIPLKIHSLYELIISGLFIIIIWPLGIEADLIIRNFFIVIGFTFFLIWLSTDYYNSSKAKI